MLIPDVKITHMQNQELPATVQLKLKAQLSS